ncbi:GreA/GreB family elongation factor [uncultured Wocania sp.]|uniref:GreA/GreB family elongation factor n=1 Tax=uncultured Wocania sp. TaxID=2834404 RepID=UPI0030F8AF7F
MKYGSLILEKKEYVYLKRILNISGYVGDFNTQKSLQELTEQLKTAHILDENEMPDDVVRFNSKVTVVSDKGWEKNLQVVIPMEKDMKQNKISILTPMGSALFGYAKDDAILWELPAGKQQLKIADVSQEETFSGMDLVV